MSSLLLLRQIFITVAYLFVCMYVFACMYIGARVGVRGQVGSFTMWAAEIKLRSSALVAGATTTSAILLDQFALKLHFFCKHFLA